MGDIPPWVGIAQILGGPIGTMANLQNKKKFNNFMFGTICEKVRVSTIKLMFSSFFELSHQRLTSTLIPRLSESLDFCIMDLSRNTFTFCSLGFSV